MQAFALLAKTGFLAARGFEAVVKASFKQSLLKAGSTVAAPFAWAMVGLVYVAETGYSYRQYKRGLITEQEFKKRAMIGAISKVSLLIGTSVGATTGFLLGTAIMPGIGSIIGVIIGGVTGG